MTDTARAQLRNDLSAEFDRKDVRQTPGKGGSGPLDYIEDETVMDRLDDALGVGNWSILTEPLSLADGVVKVRLGAKIEGEWVWFEDFGYANNLNGDALKEAVTDGIRRCGRYLGIARELYKKHSSNGTGRAAPSSSARPAAAPPRTSTSVPEEPEFPDDFGPAPTPIRPKPTGGGWTFGQLAKAAEDRGIPKNAIYAQADQLFGPKTKVTDLTGEEREQIAFEMGLTQ